MCFEIKPSYRKHYAKTRRVYKYVKIRDKYEPGNADPVRVLVSPLDWRNPIEYRVGCTYKASDGPRRSFYGKLRIKGKLTRIYHAKTGIYVYKSRTQVERNLDNNVTYAVLVLEVRPSNFLHAGRDGTDMVATYRKVKVIDAYRLIRGKRVKFKAAYPAKADKR